MLTMLRAYTLQTLSSLWQSAYDTDRSSPKVLRRVPSLSNQRTEDQLELACHEAFDTFGRCHIKIRRDKNNQPFAFVQFEVLSPVQTVKQD